MSEIHIAEAQVVEVPNKKKIMRIAKVAGIAAGTVVFATVIVAIVRNSTAPCPEDANIEYDNSEIE